MNIILGWTIDIASIARNIIPQHNIQHYGRKTFTHEELRAYCSLLLVDSSPPGELLDLGTDWYAKIYLRIPCFLGLYSVLLMPFAHAIHTSFFFQILHSKKSFGKAERSVKSHQKEGHAGSRHGSISRKWTKCTMGKSDSTTYSRERKCRYLELYQKEGNAVAIMWVALARYIRPPCDLGMVIVIMSEAKPLKIAMGI